MRLSSISLALTRLGQRLGQWSPLSLWPDGIASPGMWISPRTLDSQWQDYTGTTPVATPGSVADSANPVGLALDIRAGATTVSDPGHHMLQATSAARPLESAQVNLLQGSESSTNRANTGITPNYSYGTSGSSKVWSLTPTAITSVHKQDIASILPTGQLTLKLRAKSNGYKRINVGEGGNGQLDNIVINVQTATIETNSFGKNVTASLDEYGYCVCVIVHTYSVSPGFFVSILDDAAPGNTYGNTSYLADGTSGVLFADLQVNLGPTALPYQRVGAASDYTATGFPQYLKFDGVDDALSSATFAAGTLTSSMDCLIAVRRDSTANAVCGLYNAVADATKFFGMAESGSSSGCVGSGAGTPTVWVDGTQLTGGTAVTRGTLHTALTAGAWHILEFRNLDLSTWTKAGCGLYTSYVLKGALGDILLFASGQDANRDKARTEMAAYFGVTLA